MSDQSGSWQPDPFGRHQYRYWNGTEWSDHVSNDGVVTTDPPVAAATPVPTEPEPPSPAAETQSQPWATPEPDVTTSMPTAMPIPPASYQAAPVEAPTAKKGNNAAAFMVGGVLLALLLAAGAWFLLMGDDDETALGDRELIVAELRQAEGMTAAQANCVADELGDSLGFRELATAIRDGAEPTSRELAAFDAATARCGVTPGADGGSTDTTEDAAPGGDDDDDDGGADSGVVPLPPAMLQLIAQQIAAETGLTTGQAECFVTELFGQFGEDALGDMLGGAGGFGDGADSMSGILEIAGTCGFDPSKLDERGSSGGASGSYGDDPRLDALWDACEAGDGEACDDLYFESPFGSDYEEFGDTCGGRFEAGEVFCADEL